MSRFGKVLLADDSPHAQRMGERILREEGYEVVTVTDGETAILRFKDVNPDFVIVDTFLPQISGYELCSFIKQQPQHSHVRVILTSTALEKVDEDQASYVGADGQLKKPFEASVMLKSLKDLISGSDKDGKKRRSGLGLDLSSPVVEKPAKQEENTEASPRVSEKSEKNSSLIQAWLDKQGNPTDAQTDAPDPLGLADRPTPVEHSDLQKVSLANPQLLRNAEDEPEDLSLRNNPVAKLRNVPSPAPKEDSPRVRSIKDRVFGAELAATVSPLSTPERDNPTAPSTEQPKRKRSLLEALADYESASELQEVADRIREDEASTSTATDDASSPEKGSIAPDASAQVAPVSSPVQKPPSETPLSQSASTPQQTSVEVSVPVPLAQSGVRLDQEEIRAAVEIAVSAALPAIVAEVSRCITLALDARYRDAREKQSGRASG